MTSAFKVAMATAGKDLRSYCRDRNGLLLGLLLPVALVAAFGFIQKLVFGGDGGGMSKATLWVSDLDDSEKSREFLQGLRQSTVLRIKPGPDEEQKSGDELRALVEDGDAHHALVIEAGFEQSMADGKFPTLKMYRDPDRNMEDQLVSIGLMQAFVVTGGESVSALMTTQALESMGLPAEWHDRILALSKGFSASIGLLFDEAESEGLLESEEEASAEDSSSNEGEETDDEPSTVGFMNAMQNMVPVERVDLRPEGRQSTLSYMLAQSVSGISVMMLMFGLMACGSAMIREREIGTLQRLFVTPVSREAFLWGKYLFTFAMGALQLVILFAFGGIVFGIDMTADLPTLIVISLFVLIAVTAFGMLIAAWAKTTKQAEGVSTVVILVMSAVGGAWYPVQMVDLPLPADILVKCTLTHWAMSGYQGLFWHGKSFTDPSMLQSMAALAGFAILATLLARHFYRRRYVEGV